MSCGQAQWLHGYFDGELDAAHAAEFDAHLEGCAPCTRALAVNPLSPIARAVRGGALGALGHYDEAIAWDDKVAASPNADDNVKRIAASDKARAQNLKKTAKPKPIRTSFTMRQMVCNWRPSSAKT